MEKYTMFMDRKNQYRENEDTTESNLQIQCNPYQATSGIFHRTRTNNFKYCMEIQKKTSNSQSNLEKEEWNWRKEPAFSFVDFCYGLLCFFFTYFCPNFYDFFPSINPGVLHFFFFLVALGVELSYLFDFSLVS